METIGLGVGLVGVALVALAGWTQYLGYLRWRFEQERGPQVDVESLQRQVIETKRVVEQLSAKIAWSPPRGR